jgi:hypothetical protein
VSTLPFLQKRGWPQKQKIVGESKYGFDEDDDIIDSALDELIEAIHDHDHSRSMEAIQALWNCLDAGESSEDAINS